MIEYTTKLPDLLYSSCLSFLQHFSSSLASTFQWCQQLKEDHKFWCCSWSSVRWNSGDHKWCLQTQPRHLWRSCSTTWAQSSTPPTTIEPEQTDVSSSNDYKCTSIYITTVDKNYKRTQSRNKNWVKDHTTILKLARSMMDRSMYQGLSWEY